MPDLLPREHAARHARRGRPSTVARVENRPTRRDGVGAVALAAPGAEGAPQQHEPAAPHRHDPEVGDVGDGGQRDVRARAGVPVGGEGAGGDGRARQRERRRVDGGRHATTASPTRASTHARGPRRPWPPRASTPSSKSEPGPCPVPERGLHRQRHERRRARPPRRATRTDRDERVALGAASVHEDEERHPTGGDQDAGVGEGRDRPRRPPPTVRSSASPATRPSAPASTSPSPTPNTEPPRTGCPSAETTR